MATSQPPYATFDTPLPDQPRHVTPAAMILAAGIIAAMAILGSAVRDSVPPPQQTVVTPAPTPDDPAGP